MPPVAAAAAAVVGAISAGAAAVGTAVASALVAGGLSVGAALAVTSLGGTLLTTLLTTTALSLVGGVLEGKPNLGASSGSQSDWVADPSAGVPYAIGETGYAGSIVYRKSSGSKLKYDTFITVHSAAGPIESETAYYANSVPLGFGADSGEGQDGYYLNRMWRKASLGATPAAHLTMTATGSKDTPADHSGVPADWDAACKLSGLAADMLILEYDATIYSGGPPKPLRKFKGPKCYDPRKDDTYPGGVGSHRWADPADKAAHDAARLTWEWTPNPQIHALNWTLGRWERDLTNDASTYARILGVGAPIAGIDVAAFVDGANVSDAHGWVASGMAYSTGDKFDILTSMLQAGSARPVSVGAKISCLTNAPKVSLDTITGDDLIGEAQVAAAQARRDRINAIWPRYPEEAAGWQIVPTRVPVTVPAYEPADAGRKTKEVEYTLVPSADQVATLARYDIENSREIGPITLPLRPYWHGYKGGDCLTVNEPELGLVNQKCLLLDRKIDMASLSVTLTLRSETDGKHPYALGETADPPPIPALVGIDQYRGAPEGDAWSATADLLAGPDGSLPAIIITGAADNAHAIAVIVDYRQVFTDAEGAVTYGPWSSISYPADTTSIILTGLVPGGEYQVRVRYQTVDGASDPTVFLDLGSHTVGAVTAAAVALIDGKTPAQMSAAIAAAAQQGLDALSAAMDLANTASQAILDAKAFRDNIAALGFNLNGVPLGPVTQDLQLQGADLEASRSLMGLTAADASAFFLSDTTLKFANGDTVATRFNLLYASDASNAASASAAAAAVQTEANARAGADTAEANNRLFLAATVNSNLATYNAFASSQATTNSATSTSITSLTAQVGSNYAAFTNNVTTQATTNSATASSLTALSATVGGQSSSITNLLTVTAGLGAQAVLSLDYNGNVSGYRFANGASGSSMVFLSGTIGFTDGTGSVYPLTITGGQVRISNLVAASVEAGSIVADSIVGGAVTAAGSWSDSGGVGLSTGGETSAGGFYFTSTGGRHVINVYGEVATTSSSAAGVICRLKRNGTEIKRGNKWCPGSWGGEGIAFASLDQPGAGTWYYELTYQATGGSGACKDGQSAIILTEMKK